MPVRNGERQGRRASEIEVRMKTRWTQSFRITPLTIWCLMLITILFHRPTNGMSSCSGTWPPSMVHWSKMVVWVWRGQFATATFNRHFDWWRFHQLSVPWEDFRGSTKTTVQLSMLLNWSQNHGFSFFVSSKWLGKKYSSIGSNFKRDIDGGQSKGEQNGSAWAADAEKEQKNHWQWYWIHGWQNAPTANIELIITSHKINVILVIRERPGETEAPRGMRFNGLRCPLRFTPFLLLLLLMVVGWTSVMDPDVRCVAVFLLVSSLSALSRPLCCETQVEIYNFLLNNWMECDGNDESANGQSLNVCARAQHGQYLLYILVEFITIRSSPRTWNDSAANAWRLRNVENWCVAAV